MPRLLHNSGEARELLGGISESAFRQLTKTGALPSVRQGARVYVTAASLEACVAGLAGSRR